MPDHTNLSEREIEILRLVATGASNKEIGSILFISTNTVKVHLRNIYEKIEVNTRTEAALFALNQGLVENQLVKPETIEKNALKPGTIEEIELSHQDEEIDRKIPKAKIRKAILPIIPVIVILILSLITIFWWNKRSQFINPDLDGNKPLWNPLPQLDVGRSGLALVIYGNHLYAIGGETGEIVTGRVDRLLLDGDDWMEVSQKPTPVKNIQAVEINDAIYIPGGEFETGQVTDQLERYRPRENTWEAMAPMPEPRARYGLAQTGGSIYVFGGWNGTDYVDSVYKYSPQKNQWEELTPMPSKLGFLSAAVTGDTILVFGGKNDRGVSDILGVFSVDSKENPKGKWLQSRHLPAPRYGMGAVTLVNSIFLVGGADADNKPLPGWVYSPQEMKWKVFNSPTENALLVPGLTALGSDLYLVGGEENGDESVESFFFHAFYTALLPIVR